MLEQEISVMPAPLAPDLLKRTCTQEEIDILAKVPDTQGSILNDLFIGIDQPRFRQALELGLHVSSKKHIFIAGLSGPRALNAIKTFVTSSLVSSPKKPAPPQDWCYIHNFDNPLEPIVIPLIKGRGLAFKKRMQELCERLQERIPAALVRDEIVSERQRITVSTAMWWESIRSQIIQQAKDQSVWISFEGEYPSVGLVSQTGREIQREGRTITPLMEVTELENLPPDQHHELVEIRNYWIHQVNMATVEHERRMREMQNAVDELNRRVVGATVDDVFKNVRLTSSEHATSYGQKLKQFTVDNFGIFMPNNQQQPQSPHYKPFLPWTVNVLVDNTNQDIPPVVVNYDGTFESLVGSIRRIAGNGGVIYTDHTMITAGSLAEANNGYLIVDAMNVLRSMGSYEMLKRVLSNEVIKIEDLMSFIYGGASIMPLQPMPIPLNVKVIMVGSRYIWSLLAYHDPQFLDHFELKAEVTPSVDWVPMEASALAHWMRHYAAHKKLLPFQDTALQRVVEHASRLADNQHQLSTDFTQLEPIVCEASYLAQNENVEHVSASHVREALERKFYRSNLYAERMQRMICDKKIILPLKGEAVGQITILAVSNFGDVEIGFPGRMTCEWSAGKPGFVSIAKESNMAGDTLKKGELTVQGYLQSLFAKKYPLALNITYALEQTYSIVDGDSASMALFYCIVSSLSEVPIRQDIAITGSLSQRGEPQAIGGANEKIEGFFETCAMIGLTGTQGVIIPASNASNLMLNDRVLHAAREGTFHIWAINSIAEGMRILMGKEAGERNTDFSFTPDSVYDLVDKQLRNAALNARNFFAQKDDLLI